MFPRVYRELSGRCRACGKLGDFPAYAERSSTNVAEELLAVGVIYARALRSDVGAGRMRAVAVVLG